MSAGSADKAYRELKQKFSEGAFDPGGRLNETALAQEIGVSRTPLREALNRLVGAGLLRARHGEGFQTRSEEDSYLKACGVLRRDLLWLALAPALAEPRYLRTLIRGYDKPRGDMTPLQDAHRFLLRLASLAGNKALVRQMDGLNDALAQRDKSSRMPRPDLRRNRLILDLAFRREEAAWKSLHNLLDLPVTAPPPNLSGD